MSVCESTDAQSRSVSRDLERASMAAVTSDNAKDYGLQRMLDLLAELRCYILELLIIDKSFVAYYTLLEHLEIGELVRRNFNAQLKAVRGNRHLARQVQQILVTTALVSTHSEDFYLSWQLAEFLSEHLLDESVRISLGNPMQTVAALRKCHTRILDAETLTNQFAKMVICNAVARYIKVDRPRFGTNTLSDVEDHRILRAFIRSQLYAEVWKQYGARKTFKRIVRSLFSLWTTWEFEEVRSLVEWIRIERLSLPEQYSKSIHDLFALVDATEWVVVDVTAIAITIGRLDLVRSLTAQYLAGERYSTAFVSGS